MLIKIGTRRSPLALAQTNYVIHLIKQKYPESEFSLHSITTIADKDRVSEFHQFGIVGVFSTEHEQQLISHEVDIVVHSLKDLPTNLAEGLVLAAVPERRDARDILCGTTLVDLKQGATVGTGSLRRKAQILSLRPDVNVVPIRGNIGPRLARIDGEDGLDAVILAHAGLQRLNLAADKAEVMAPEVFPYAVGQGALGIEARAEDTQIIAMLKDIECSKARAEVDCERAMLHALGAGCSLPVGVNAEWKDGNLVLTGQVTSLNGEECVTAVETASPDAATDLGIRTAEVIRQRGGVKILEHSYKSFCGHYKFIN